MFLTHWHSVKSLHDLSVLVINFIQTECCFYYFLISLQRCVFINKSHNPRLFMYDNLQLFKWTEQVLVHTYFNQAFVFWYTVMNFSAYTGYMGQGYLYLLRITEIFPLFLFVFFFQDAACKRPWWTEDHFSHCSFVCWKDSTWVGVSINNQIQGESVGEGGGAREEFGWRTVPPRPWNPGPCFSQKWFILLTQDKKPYFMILLPFVSHTESGNFQ